MALVEIREGVGQPPIELTARLQRLLEVVRRELGVSGKIVD
jgi:hypothetical protein